MGTLLSHSMSHMALFGVYHSLKYCLNVNPQLRLPQYTQDQGQIGKGLRQDSQKVNHHKLVLFLQDFAIISSIGIVAGLLEETVSHYTSVLTQETNVTDSKIKMKDYINRVKNLPLIRANIILSAGIPSALGFLALEFDLSDS